MKSAKTFGKIDKLAFLTQKVLNILGGKQISSGPEWENGFLIIFEVPSPKNNNKVHFLTIDFTRKLKADHPIEEAMIFSSPNPYLINRFAELIGNELNENWDGEYTLMDQSYKSQEKG